MQVLGPHEASHDKIKTLVWVGAENLVLEKSQGTAPDQSIRQGRRPPPRFRFHRCTCSELSYSPGVVHPECGEGTEYLRGTETKLLFLEISSKTMKTKTAL